MRGGGSTKDYGEISQVDLGIFHKDSRLCLLSPAAVLCTLHLREKTTKIL